MSRKALEIALAAGQDLMRRLDLLKVALEAGQDDVALNLAREITGAEKRTPREKETAGREIKGDDGDIANKYLLNDDNRLLRGEDARKFLGNMSVSTFYRNIDRGTIPKPRYMGRSSVWRLGDLRSVYSQLPSDPPSAEVVVESK